jgi:hypothetical protein
MIGANRFENTRFNVSFIFSFTSCPKGWVWAMGTKGWPLGAGRTKDEEGRSGSTAGDERGIETHDGHDDIESNAKVIALQEDDAEEVADDCVETEDREE